MLIEPFAYNVPAERSPVELCGENADIFAVASIFGLKSPAAWRLGAFTLFNELRGRDTTSVLISPAELAKLALKATASAASELAAESMSPDNFMHVHQTAPPGNTVSHKQKVITAVLDYCTYCPVPHDPF